MRVQWDASEIDGLVNDLRRVPATVERRNEKTMQKTTRAVLSGWKRRARETSGKHGKLYPNSITAESTGILEFEIGPDVSLPQGGMGRGFEWGGPSVITNPGTGPNRGGWWLSPQGWKPGGFLGQRVGQDTPHLSMTLTMDEQEPKFEAAVADDVEPWW